MKNLLCKRELTKIILLSMCFIFNDHAYSTLVDTYQDGQKRHNKRHKASSDSDVNMQYRNHFMNNQDHSFITIDSKKSLDQIGKNYINSNNEWIHPQSPIYISYTGELTPDIHTTIQKFLSIGGLEFFCISERSDTSHYNFVIDYFFEFKNDEFKVLDRSFEKLIWLNRQSTLESLSTNQNDESNYIPSWWIEKHRMYYDLESQYKH